MFCAYTMASIIFWQHYITLLTERCTLLVKDRPCVLSWVFKFCFAKRTHHDHQLSVKPLKITFNLTRFNSIKPWSMQYNNYIAKIDLHIVYRNRQWMYSAEKKTTTILPCFSWCIQLLCPCLRGSSHWAWNKHSTHSIQTSYLSQYPQ